MMINLKNKSVFHKIGQGQFFTGEFSSLNSYNYIVDCGSENKNKSNLDTEIDKYLEKLENKVIDLFIISHFHEDHFCGIEKFKNVEIKRLILPYLTEIEKIYLCTRIIFKFRSEKGGRYSKFIMNPINFLEEEGFNINEVIFVKPNGKDDPKKETYNDKDIQYDRENSSNELIELYDAIIMGNEVNLNGVESKSEIRYCIYENLVIGILDLIEFDFYNNIMPNESLIQFSNMKINDVTIGEYFKNNTIQQIIAELKNTKKQIRSAYEQVDKKINNAALCVSVTAVGDYNVSRIELNKTRYTYNGEYEAKLADKEAAVDMINALSTRDYAFMVTNNRWGIINEYGYMFTGDISLSDGEVNMAFDNFIDHYMIKKDKIKIFVVPHHGSKNNWSKRILHNFSNSIFMVSAGLDNQYSHPHILVCSDIDTESRLWVWVNENIDCSMCYILKFEK